MIYIHPLVLIFPSESLLSTLDLCQLQKLRTHLSFTLQTCLHRPYQVSRSFPAFRNKDNIRTIWWRFFVAKMTQGNSLSLTQSPDRAHPDSGHTILVMTVEYRMPAGSLSRGGSHNHSILAVWLGPRLLIRPMSSSMIGMFPAPSDIEELWACCMCGNGGMTVAINVSCHECDHAKCGACTIEEVQ
jgi:hypothetical protein